MIVVIDILTCAVDYSIVLCVCEGEREREREREKRWWY